MSGVSQNPNEHKLKKLTPKVFIIYMPNNQEKCLRSTLEWDTVYYNISGFQGRGAQEQQLTGL